MPILYQKGVVSYQLGRSVLAGREGKKADPNSASVNASLSNARASFSMRPFTQPRQSNTMPSVKAAVAVLTALAMRRCLNRKQESDFSLPKNPCCPPRSREVLR
jgi:hypothetical protein